MSDITRHPGADHEQQQGPSNDAAVKRSILDFPEAVAGNPKLYTQKDIDAAKKMASDAEKMLGQLDIDHKPGVSRSEIISAESKQNVSAHDMRIYGALNNIEPGVQDAWQVPDHRKHLMDHARAQFYRDAAQVLARNGEKNWAAGLTGEAARLDGPASIELKKDRTRQDQVYFHQGEVTPEKLEFLKEAIKRVDLAAHVLPQADKVAQNLLKKLDPSGHGLTNDQIAKLAQAPDNKNLTFEEKTILKGLADFEIFTPRNSLVPAKEMAREIRYWASNESRADSNNNEKLFFQAMEGYSGNGLDIRSDKRFNREMDSKDMSQLHADQDSFQYHSIPHFPKPAG